MANEIFAPNMTVGDVLYVVEFNAAGQAYKTTGSPGFATYTNTRSDFVGHRATVGSNGNYGPYSKQTDTTEWLIFSTIASSGSESDTADIAVFSEEFVSASGGGGGDTTNNYTLAGLGYMLRGTQLMFVDAAGTTGLTDLRGVLINTNSYAYNTSTGSFNTWVGSTTWSTALNTLTELPGQAGTGLAVYATSVPTPFTVGDYSFIVQQGDTQASPRKLVAQFYWDGQTAIPMEGILADAYGALRPRSPVGLGSISKSFTVTANDGNAVPNAVVYVARDPHNMVIDSGPQITDDLGNVTFLLNPGTYYGFAHRANVNVINPIVINVP